MGQGARGTGHGAYSLRQVVKVFLFLVIIAGASQPAKSADLSYFLKQFAQAIAYDAIKAAYSLIGSDSGPSENELDVATIKKQSELSLRSILRIESALKELDRKLEDGLKSTRADIADLTGKITLEQALALYHNVQADAEKRAAGKSREDHVDREIRLRLKIALSEQPFKVQATETSVSGNLRRAIAILLIARASEILYDAELKGDTYIEKAFFDGLARSIVAVSHEIESRAGVRLDIQRSDEVLAAAFAVWNSNKLMESIGKRAPAPVGMATESAKLCVYTAPKSEDYVERELSGGATGLCVGLAVTFCTVVSGGSLTPACLAMCPMLSQRDVKKSRMTRKIYTTEVKIVESPPLIGDARLYAWAPGTSKPTLQITSEYKNLDQEPSHHGAKCKLASGPGDVDERLKSALDELEATMKAMNEAVYAKISASTIIALNNETRRLMAVLSSRLAVQ